jgi:dihydroorotase
MREVLIQNANLVNEGELHQKDLLIRGEKIAKISNHIAPTGSEELIDAKGLHLLPGWIDDQVHFREPGLTHKATIASESRAAVAGGITSFIEMPNTNPQTTSQNALEDKLDRAAKTSIANYGFLFGGTNDNLEEIKTFDNTQAAGIKLFLGSSTGNMLVDDEEVLQKIFSCTDLPIAVHCEDENTIRKNLSEHIAKYGDEIPIEKHPEIRSEAACYRSSSQAIRLAKATGARLHVFHLSTAIETELFSNDKPLAEKKITAEVCVHHLWFSEEDYAQKGTLIKWNPAVKKVSDREALWKALNEDKIDILATDHAPHTLKEKQNPYTKAPSGGPLVQHAYIALLTAVQQGKTTLEKLVEKACHNPAILFKIQNRGFLREGYFADLVLVDLNHKYTVVKEDLRYQCGWSPFEGTTFGATINKTFVNGNLVYDEGEIIECALGKKLTFER